MAPEPGDHWSPLWPILVGIVTGTVWRAQFWFENGKVMRKLVIRDLCSFGVLAVASMAVIAATKIEDDIWAVIIACALTLAGVDWVRTRVLSGMEIIARRWLETKGERPGDDEP